MAATTIEKRQLTLTPEGTRGRIVAPRAIERGRLYLLDAGGNVVADVMVGEDGVFSYNSAVPAAAAVIASASLPLTVVRPIAPPENGTELVIPLPAAPTRELTIRTAPGSARKGARVGIAVAGTVIPANALSLHQASRNEQAVILENRPMPVFDIAEVGPISVLLGPDPDDRSVPPDAVSRPEFVNVFPKHVLSAGERDVVFP